MHPFITEHEVADHQVRVRQAALRSRLVQAAAAARGGAGATSGGAGVPDAVDAHLDGSVAG